jgi:8-oxo-dGTP diphosphatase
VRNYGQDMADPVVPTYCVRCATALEPGVSHGQSRLVCPACGHVAHPDPKVAVGVFCVHEGALLLVRQRHGRGRGSWSLPGGHLDAGEDPRSAAQRETLEEAGLVVTAGGVRDVFADEAVVFVLFDAEWVAGEPAGGDDADAAGFFAPGSLPVLAERATGLAIRRWAAGVGI